jgi:hypothetical protein
MSGRGRRSTYKLGSPEEQQDARVGGGAFPGGAPAPKAAVQHPNVSAALRPELPASGAARLDRPASVVWVPVDPERRAAGTALRLRAAGRLGGSAAEFSNEAGAGVSSPRAGAPADAPDPSSSGHATQPHRNSSGAAATFRTMSCRAACLTRKCSRQAGAGRGTVWARRSWWPDNGRVNLCGRHHDRLQLICIVVRRQDEHNTESKQCLL